MVCKTIGVAQAKLKQPGAGHKTITMKGKVVARPVPPFRMYLIKWEDGQESLCASIVLDRVESSASASAPMQAPAAAAPTAPASEDEENEDSDRQDDEVLDEAVPDQQTTAPDDGQVAIVDDGTKVIVTVGKGDKAESIEWEQCEVSVDARAATPLPSARIIWPSHVQKVC